ncbi:hypothetical protein [Paenibacillus chitinolyticus]|uniref:hypothetical protein n=1 Tax=Paenibacillus chitinolyticus TaxID=79263 RepID=UPI00364E7794
MRKRVLGGFAVIAVLTGIAVLAEYVWPKPYEIPAIADNVTIAQYGLDFTKERSTDLRTAEGNIEFLMAAVKKDPDNLVYSNVLRLKMAEEAKTNDYISFMEEVKPTAQSRLQQALAYVDLLQDKDLGTAVLGQKSARSIQILDGILEENPHNVLAHYSRGLNNLYWPKGLRRSENAIQDLSYCLAVADKLEQQDKDLVLWPMVYAALGDALVKNGDTRKGMSVWKQGSVKYPTDTPLKQRAGADEKQAYEIVKKERGIDGFTRPDARISDLSKIWVR